MTRIADIIACNKALRRAREERDVAKFEKFILKIHKMEIKDGVALGMYVLKF